MHAHISISGRDEVTEYAALASWLSEERELDGPVRMIQRKPQDGELGGVYDVLSVAVGSGGAVAVLARSLVTWLQARRSDVEVTISHPKGGSVKVNARRIKDVDLALLIQEVRAALPFTANSELPDNDRTAGIRADYES
jgi:Effector Associated Constant Component 1